MAYHLLSVIIILLKCSFWLLEQIGKVEGVGWVTLLQMVPTCKLMYNVFGSFLILVGVAVQLIGYKLMC